VATGTTAQPSLLAPEDGLHLDMLGTLATFKAFTQGTNGAYWLFEGRIMPGEGAPLHQFHAAQYRQIVELRRLRNSRWIVALGQGGDPDGPHYDDLIARWQSGGYVPMGVCDDREWPSIARISPYGILLLAPMLHASAYPRSRM
jgi:hypothetical protein